MNQLIYRVVAPALIGAIFSAMGINVFEDGRINSMNLLLLIGSISIWLFLMRDKK